MLDKCAVFRIIIILHERVLLTFLLDELVEKAGLANTGVANHQKLEQVICTRSKRE